MVQLLRDIETRRSVSCSYLHALVLACAAISRCSVPIYELSTLVAFPEATGKGRPNKCLQHQANPICIMYAFYNKSNQLHLHMSGLILR
jgi:hypothetical protein